jgi:hypothetical protein
MSSRAEYRRLGLAAKQRAAESPDQRVKEAFKDVARHWFALAERIAWVDKQRQQPEKKGPQKKGPEDYRRLADQCRQAAHTVSTQEERDELLERAKTWDFLAKRPPIASSRLPPIASSRLNEQ